MKVQSIQPTPNPNAFKFVVDDILYDGTRNYTGRDQAAGHALAEELFTIDGVETLFFCDRFVTLSMTPDADWRAVHEKATRIIEDSEPIEVAPQPAGPSAEGPVIDSSKMSEADVALLDRVNEILDDRVRPALAGDGGGLEILGLSDKTLQIRYQGACGTCPSSIAGTLMAIQNLLQSEVDEELSVVSA